MFEICRKKDSVTNYLVLTETTLVINSFPQILVHLLFYIIMLILLFTTTIIIVVFWEKNY